MVDYTVTTNVDQEAALASYAVAQGTTQANLLQAEANTRIDMLVENTYSSWWNGLTLAEKKIVYDANQ